MKSTPWWYHDQRLKIHEGRGIELGRIEYDRSGASRPEWLPKFVGVTSMPESKERPKRGRIQGFSRSSRRRMREKLLRLRPAPGYITIGATLTIPGDTLTPETRRVVWDTWKEHHRAQAWGCIWRYEEQARKQGHWHLIMSLPWARLKTVKAMGVVDLPKDQRQAWAAEHADSLRKEVSRAWGKAIAKAGQAEFKLHGRPFRCLRHHAPGYEKHGVQIDAIEGDGDRYMRYLNDHSSKRKRGQVAAEVGCRHWGVLGKRLAWHEPGPDSVHNLKNQPDLAWQLRRALSARMRRSVPDDRAPFGRRKARRRKITPHAGVTLFGVQRITKRLVEDLPRIIRARDPLTVPLQDRLDAYLARANKHPAPHSP